MGQTACALSVIACGDATSPKGRGKSAAGNFLIMPNTLATSQTACALSVTCGDSSPKGRAKSTPIYFVIAPDTLATDFKSWLPL